MEGANPVCPGEALGPTLSLAACAAEDNYAELDDHPYTCLRLQRLRPSLTVKACLSSLGMISDI